jgi:hypothetical protein
MLRRLSWLSGFCMPSFHDCLDAPQFKFEALDLVLNRHSWLPARLMVECTQSQLFCGLWSIISPPAEFAVIRSLLEPVLTRILFPCTVSDSGAATPGGADGIVPSRLSVLNGTMQSMGAVGNG